MASRLSAAADAGGFDGQCVGALKTFPTGRDRDADSKSPGETNQYWIPPMGLDGAVSVDEKVADSGSGGPRDKRLDAGKNWYLYLGVLLVAGAVYLGCIVSPPSLMDDVDAVQAQISRNMLTSGDWVTARLDGVVYLEKAPFVYWAMAASYVIFGAHDWAARIPIALSAIGLCW